MSNYKSILAEYQSNLKQIDALKKENEKTLREECLERIRDIVKSLGGRVVLDTRIDHPRCRKEAIVDELIVNEYDKLVVFANISDSEIRDIYRYDEYEFEATPTIFLLSILEKLESKMDTLANYHPLTNDATPEYKQCFDEVFCMVNKQHGRVGITFPYGFRTTIERLETRGSRIRATYYSEDANNYGAAYINDESMCYGYLCELRDYLKKLL